VNQNKDQIVNNGGTVKDRCQVTRIDPGDPYISVQCRGHRDEYVALESIVVAAGAWTPKLLQKTGLFDHLRFNTVYAALMYFPLAREDASVARTGTIHYDRAKSFSAWTHPEIEYPGLVKVMRKSSERFNK
jgi:glycine/D-amino acid oxidase-like deaminating enzyme